MFTYELPFFFEPQIDSSNSGFPFSQPFDLYHDEQLNLYRQRVSPVLRDLLRQVYLHGSTLGAAMNRGAGEVYLESAQEFLKSCSIDLPGRKLLEIGCGNGTLLEFLSSQGSICTGLEPGVTAPHLGITPGIRIIDDFFPTPRIDGDRFDIICHFNVLEHIEDPITFLNLQRQLLREGGSIIFGVPNCAEHLSVGDLSMMIHEHCSYFTMAGLASVASAAGLRVAKLVKGAAGGMLFAQLTEGEADELDLPPPPLNFESKARIALSRIEKLLSPFSDTEFCAYCPTRAMNALFLLKRAGARLVDDNTAIHHLYIPGFASPIESFEEICEKPPKCILIFSRTFSEVIRSRCLKSARLRNTRVVTIAELDV